MARTKMVARWTYRPTRCRVLVLSLLLRIPTAVDTAGVKTRARSRRISAAAAALPEEILVWEIFVRLPAKDILRCRAVCRSWRGLTSSSDFLHAHHQHQPSLPLITLYCTEGTDGALPIVNHGRPVLRFDGDDSFQVLASCDGLLLLYLSNGRFSICNPTTRWSAPLPCLAAARYIAALYLHHPSGKYRILYRKETHGRDAYYVLTVGQGQSPRCIGVPSNIAGLEKAMPSWHGMHSNKLPPPVVSRNCLHWDLGCSHTGIAVFDTVTETFRLMRRPAGASKLCTRLCDMEGSIGFSCHDDGGMTVSIWVLEDYDREVWSLKHHVELPVESSRYLTPDTQHLVLSHKGDLLVYKPYSSYMLRCDSTGKLLEEFQCDPRGFSVIGHRFKESLVKHGISLRRGYARVLQWV